jgi:hypothetical protein
MTIQTYEIICSECTYRSQYVPQVKFKHSNAFKPGAPSVTLKWCDDCVGLTQAISFTSKQVLEEEILDLKKQMITLAKPSSFLGKVFGASAKHLKMLKIYEDKIFDLNSCLQEINEIKKPYCLVCGSVNVQNVVMPDKIFPAHNFIDATHSCGGLIMAKLGFRYHIDLPEVESKFFKG